MNECQQCQCNGIVPIVTQSHTGLHDRPIVNSTHELAKKCLHYFLLSENVLHYKIGTKMIYVAYKTLLVMFCVLKYYFVDFNGMFTSFQGCQIWQSENACAL